jgi:hypothetical protein
VLPVRYELNLHVMEKKVDRLCGLVARVPGSILCTTRFSER